MERETHKSQEAAPTLTFFNRGGSVTPCAATQVHTHSDDDDDDDDEEEDPARSPWQARVTGSHAARTWSLVWSACILLQRK